MYEETVIVLVESHRMTALSSVDFPMLPDREAVDVHALLLREILLSRLLLCPIRDRTQPFHLSLTV